MNSRLYFFNQKYKREFLPHKKPLSSQQTFALTILTCYFLCNTNPFSQSFSQRISCMQISKSLLLIALSVSFHGAIISMEEADHDTNIRKACEIANLAMKHAKGQIEEQSQHVLNFTDDFESNQQDMLLVGIWLTQQRNKFPDKQYKTLLNKLIHSCPLCGCLCPLFTRRRAVRKAIDDVASALKPGEDCSKFLVTHAQKILRDLEKSDSLTSK